MHDHPANLRYPRGLALAYVTIAKTLSYWMGRNSEALPAFQRAIDIYASLSNNHPEVAEYQSGLAGSRYDMGKC